eukprot:EG_transcript_4819
MPAATPRTRTPCLAVVAAEAEAIPECVTGTVVVDRHAKDIQALRSQLRFMTAVKTVDGRRLQVAAHVADGTWASVYKVYDEATSRTCALKVVPVEGCNVDSVYDNIEVLRRLPHPNVVQYYSHFTMKINHIRCLCVELEFADGGTLADYVRAKAKQKGHLSAARVQDFAAQLATALAFIHERGCLHGDLRPESVLVTVDKQLKLTSFGSPLWVERKGLTPRTITGGCKTYAPPEWMASELPHRKLRSCETPLSSYDMWSLGCVLTELVTLKLLSDQPWLQGCLAADVEGQHGVAKEVAAFHGGLFSPLLGSLLDPDPDARGTAPEALAALRGLAGPGRSGLRGLRPQKALGLVTSLCRPLTHLASRDA